MIRFLYVLTSSGEDLDWWVDRFADRSRAFNATAATSQGRNRPSYGRGE